MLEKLVHILPLREEESVGRPSDGNAKKVTEGTKVGHSKLGMKGASDVAKKRGARGGKDNIIDVYKVTHEI